MNKRPLTPDDFFADPGVKRAMAEGRLFDAAGNPIESYNKKPSGKSKYGNIRCEIDGRKFASKKEAARYLVLKSEQDAGLISGLRCQVPYKLTERRKYVADFVYIRDGVEVVEDVKGYETDVYKLKRDMMREIHGITITEVR